MVFLWSLSPMSWGITGSGSASTESSKGRLSETESKELFVNRFVLSGVSIRNVLILSLQFVRIFQWPALPWSLPLLPIWPSKDMWFATEQVHYSEYFLSDSYVCDVDQSGNYQGVSLSDFSASSPQLSFYANLFLLCCRSHYLSWPIKRDLSGPYSNCTLPPLLWGGLWSCTTC